LLIYLVILAASVAASPAQAGLPTYKCQTGKGVEYSDNPCIGATVVDTTPTRGMDKSSGKSVKGAAVQKEETNEAMAKALKPLTGWTPDQRETAIRRVYLPPSAKGQCQALDNAIPREEAAVLAATRGEKARFELSLYQSRKRYKDLKC